MKYLLILLFICGYGAVAQEGRAIISLDKDNIVYRGIDNLLKIGVPAITQDKITVTAPGELSPVENKPGYYHWNVTAVSGTRAKITISYKLEDGKTVAENKEFRVVPLPPLYASIESQQTDSNIYHLTRKEIADLVLKIKSDTYHEINDLFKIKGFTLYTPEDTLIIEGNTLPDSIKVKIDTLQTGTILTITYIRIHSPYPGMLMKDVAPLIIEVADDPLPVTEEDIPRPVIYNTRYETVYRGTGNHFSISVPDAKSFTVTGPGVKQYSKDSFDLNLPVDYKENRVFVDVAIVTKTDSVVKYQYMYIVKNIETRMLINGQGCEKCIVQESLKELENARVSVQYPDIRPFNTVIVMSFIVTLPNGDTIHVQGDHISNEAHFFIEQFTKPGDIITIDQIRYRIPGVDL